MLFLLFSVLSFADCKNFIARSEIPKAIAMEAGAGAKKCGGGDPCVCFDGIDWETAEYLDGELRNVSAKVDQKAAKKLSDQAKANSDAAAKNSLIFKLKKKELSLEEIQELLLKIIK